MISFLRHKSVQRGLFLALCVLVIPGFVFLSISHDKSPMSGDAGTIGGRKIKVQEFIRNFDAMRRELEVFGGADLSKLGQSVDFEALAWQRILLVGAAKDSGIRVSDADVVAWIQKQKVFEENGAFSKERYELVVNQYLKMDPKSFEEECREYLALQRYRDKIRGDFKVTDADLRERFKLIYGPRQLEYVIITKDDVAAPSPATEDELKSMYNRLSGRLFSQEAAQVRYLTAPAGTDTAAESTAKEWDSESTRTPFFAKEEPIPGIGVAPKLSEAIFALKAAKERTAWLEHDGKKYIFELIEHKPQAPMAYDDAQKVLTDLVGQEKTFRAVIEKANEFHEALDQNDWSKAVADQKLQIHTMAAYVPGDYIDKIGKMGNIAQALAELEPGKVSGPMPTSNGLAVFKVISQSAPDEKLFEEKRKDLEQDLRLRHEMEVFGKALKALQSSLTINTEVLSKLFPTKYTDPTASK